MEGCANCHGASVLVCSAVARLGEAEAAVFDAWLQGCLNTTVARVLQAICRQAEICYDNQGFYAQLMDEQGGYENVTLSKARLPLDLYSVCCAVAHC